MPHIVLDSKSNNHLLTRTNLPKSFHKSQILGLEGDFERHFTVYTSKDYKHDTLHILTPDLIELFIDRLSQYDIEFVGTSLYIYKNKWFDLDQQETIEDILAITDEIGAAIKKRTKRRANDLVLTDEHGKLK